MRAKFGKCSECDSDKEVLLFRRNPPQCEYHYKKQKSEIYQERARKKAPKQRKKIKQFSDKKLKELAKYRKKRDNYLTEHPVCEVYDCAKPSTNLHHKAGRDGSLLTDERYFMACCSSCHPQRIHFESPAWARESGYLITIK